MSDNTGISWADASWSPMTGCSPVSPACLHCYARTMALRLQAMGQAKYVDGFACRFHRDALDEPRHWRKPRRVFVNSMSDTFHEEFSNEQIVDVFLAMNTANWHTYLILTKRPERALRWLAWLRTPAARVAWPLPPDVFPQWFGVTAEDQPRADERVPLALQFPAALHFVSVEPILGPVDLRRYLPCGCCPRKAQTTALDWVIVGGESGAGARPLDIADVQSLRDQCAKARVPFMWKQDSGVHPQKLPLLNGVRHVAVPEVLP